MLKGLESDSTKATLPCRGDETDPERVRGWCVGSYMGGWGKTNSTYHPSESPLFSWRRVLPASTTHKNGLTQGAEGLQNWRKSQFTGLLSASLREEMPARRPHVTQELPVPTCVVERAVCLFPTSAPHCPLTQHSTTGVTSPQLPLPWLSAHTLPSKDAPFSGNCTFKFCLGCKAQCLRT